MKKETIKRRRKEIFEAALKVFAKKGFDKTTMDEIAELIHISKPALYLYFKSKDELFFAMVDDRLKDVGNRLNEITQMNITSIEKLKKLIASYIDFYRENLDFFKIVHNIKSQIDIEERTKFKKRFFNKYKNYTEKVSNLIQQCIDEGYLKNNDKYFYTFSLMGIIGQNIFRSILHNATNYLENISEKIFNLFLKGAGK